MSRYQITIPTSNCSFQALITNGPLCIFFLEPAKLGNPDGPLGTGKTDRFTKSVVHVALELLSMLGLLAKLCNFHSISMSTLRCSLENVFEDYHQTSIHIPILNPKTFMVINSELKVAPSVFSPPPFKAPTGGFVLKKKPRRSWETTPPNSTPWQKNIIHFTS